MIPSDFNKVIKISCPNECTCGHVYDIKTDTSIKRIDSGVSDPDAYEFVVDLQIFCKKCGAEVDWEYAWVDRFVDALQTVDPSFHGDMKVTHMHVGRSPAYDPKTREFKLTIQYPKIEIANLDNWEYIFDVLMDITQERMDTSCLDIEYNDDDKVLVISLDSKAFCSGYFRSNCTDNIDYEDFEDSAEVEFSVDIENVCECIAYGEYEEKYE